MDAVVDSVTACAVCPAEAFAWITRIEADDCTFEELAVVDLEWESLEAKLRSGISKHTLGAEALKAAELVAELTRTRESLRRAARPSQISGRQLVFTVRRFYHVDEDEHGSASFELGTPLAVG